LISQAARSFSILFNTPFLHHRFR